MIIHCTKKLAAKLSKLKMHIQTEAEVQAETSPLGSWHAQVYEIDNRDCILFTNDRTRYSMFMPGLSQSHFEHFDQSFKDIFMASLFKQSVSDSQLMQVELALGKMTLDSTTNRSVMGSLNNLRHMVDGRLERVSNVMELDIVELNKFLPIIPMSGKDIGGHIFPEDEMKKLIAAL